MNLPWDSLTLDELCTEIETGKPSSISRFGDGEFYWIIGVPGFTNRSGHETIPAGSEELRQTLLTFSRNYGPPERHCLVEERAGGAGGAEELRQVLLDQPPYRLAGPLFFRNYGTPEREAKWKAIENWIRGNHLEHLRWCSNLLFVKGMVRAAQTRTVFPLLQTIRKLPVVIVGPYWLRKLDGKVLGVERFIEVPTKNCWLEKPRIRAEIEQAHRELGPGVFYSLSCCYTANLLVHELYDTVGRDSWLMDVGSVWDIYAGVIQRGFHLDIQKRWGGVVL